MFRKWRRIFWRWHRRVGISAFAFLALMATTGIILNHADGWRLYNARLPYWFADFAYGDLDSRQVRVIEFEDVKVEQLGEDLVLNGQRLETSCETHISGFVFLEDLYWLGCGETIVGVTESGKFVERLPLGSAELEGLAVCDSSLCVAIKSGWLKLDYATLELSPVESELTANAPATERYESLPPHLQITPSEYNVGRLISDLHSGAIFKAPGRLFVDLLGFVVLFLAATGCYLWFGNKRGPGSKR